MGNFLQKGPWAKTSHPELNIVAYKLHHVTAKTGLLDSSQNRHVNPTQGLLARSRAIVILMPMPNKTVA